MTALFSATYSAGPIACSPPSAFVRNVNSTGLPPSAATTRSPTASAACRHWRGEITPAAR